MARLAGTAATRPVVIIGAGIQGCATAFFMSQRGQPVIVLEKDHVGRHASGVNAGGVRRLGRDIAEIPLSLASMDWWNQIDQLLDIDKGFHRKFYVKVALDDAALVFGQAVGVFPQRDVAGHVDLLRHPVVGTGGEVFLPSPFVFKGDQLVDVGLTIDDALVSSIHTFGVGCFGRRSRSDRWGV